MLTVSPAVAAPPIVSVACPLVESTVLTAPIEPEALKEIIAPVCAADMPAVERVVSALERRFPQRFR
jgi:hypothetical protein